MLVDQTGDEIETVTLDEAPVVSQVVEQPESNENTEPMIVAQSESAPITMGRGKQKKFPNVRLQDYIVGTVGVPTTSLSSSDSPSLQLSSGTAYPLSNYVSCDRFLLIIAAIQLLSLQTLSQQVLRKQ